MKTFKMQINNVLNKKWMNMQTIYALRHSVYFIIFFKCWKCLSPLIKFQCQYITHALSFSSIINRSSTHLSKLYVLFILHCSVIVAMFYILSCSLPSRSRYLCRAESRTWNAGWKHSNYLSGQSNALISSNMWAVISCFVIYRHRSEDILVVFSVYFQTKSTNPTGQNNLQSEGVSLKHFVCSICVNNIANIWCLLNNLP